MKSRVRTRQVIVVVVAVLLGQLQAEGGEFERLPSVHPKNEKEPLVFPLNGLTVAPAKYPGKQLVWLQDNDSLVQHAFGAPAQSVELTSWTEMPVATVRVDEEETIEPIERGPATQEPGCCLMPCPSCRPQTCWTFRADALMLWRTKSREIKIVEEGTGTPPRGQRDALLTTDALHQDPAWGPRLMIGHRLDDCRQIEMTYFGLNHWTSQAAFDGINGVGFSFLNIDVPFDANITSDFDGAQYVSATYASEIHSAEINVRTDDRWNLNRSAGYPWYEYVDLLAGIRYFRLSEEFDLASTDAGETSNYLIDASNDLVGAQFGLIAGAHCTPLLSWNAAAKAGVYANLGRQSTLLRDDENTVLLRDFTTRGEEVAFLGELNANLGYDIHPNATVTAGYSLVWLDGVALAPEQLDFTTTATSGSALNQNGNLLLHGLFVGLQVDH